MSATAELLEAIREEARPDTWSAGMGLARAGAVSVQSVGEEEAVLRVRAAGRPTPLTTVLYPEDEIWECDCKGRVDPCEHVVAAAVFFHQSQSQRAPTPRAPAPRAPAAPAASRPVASQAPATARPGGAPAKPERMVYRFKRVDGGLQLERLVVRPDNTARLLARSLASVLTNPVEAARIHVDPCDLVADKLLLKPTKGALPPERLEALLRALEPARTVIFDGALISVSAEPLLPRVTVEDRGEQTVLKVDKDPNLTEVVAPGFALSGGTLCRLGEQALTGPRLEHLPQVRAFSPEQMGELTGKVLPDLARRLPVDVRSQRLPPIDRTLKPRISIELNQLAAGLSALPTLVYGSPPSVRIDNGRMVFIKGAVPVRDEAAEQRLIHQLRDDLNMVPGRRVTVQGQEAVQLASKLRRWSGSLTGDAARIVGANVKLRPVLSVDTATTQQGVPRVEFTMDFQVEGAEPGAPRTVDAASVIRAWEEGLGLVALEGGGWAPLPAEWLKSHGQRVADLLAAREKDGRLANHAIPQLTGLCEELDHPPPPGLERLAPLVQGFEKLPDVTLPKDLTATLRPYQLQGVSWLTFLKQAGLGGVLADDMGLGKTLQTICTLGPGTLVVAPTSVLPNWEAEVKRFRPSLKVSVYHGPGRALDESADVTLTTYALMRLDAEVLGARTWDTVVLDEAQAIKNPDSQVARAAYGLQAAFRVALSGTPIENRLEELWSLMHFTNRGLLGGRKEFDERWSRPVTDNQKGAAERLRARIRPFVLRRLKRDVAPELPPRTEAVRHVTLSERERAVYDAVYAATREEVVSQLDAGGNVLKALEALLRLRQAACHPALVPGQQAKTSSKVQALVEALGTAVEDGHKALVFSQWTSMLDLIEPALKEADIGFIRLDGTTSNRGAVAASFQDPKGPPVMLISLKAGATGLNLTAADHVFLVDPWWNPSVEAQAADRAHRIGQQRPVMVYRLVSQGTVEEKILTLQEKKRALFESALGGAEGATALTRADLMQLLD
ncbi:DEAD/DEAH box helicase [Pyxidicoccus fallax]|uniref:DEAD/DEAH box helicase n=1 Tax=Pyxidicoccus fallax TaxID=394095 RepID=A0A848L5R6_9BACT|nr:DEAD/DEAH box helicase [Pyxidicoccus fallax]NMO13956.1 DEAD/DEAH box helicase [Pyxidicoccus fallax]NPC78355.1 DEAD/DEAH box helicase [Pyxidicoccus fallax]